ncbi:TPA: hypothetical protein DCW54_00260 [Candidatus Dependentiae bacterium]|nr:hypothetical protein [Candidatus Dependentiae bacterium]
MKLHISFNQESLHAALECANQVVSWCDAFRLGPVLLFSRGMSAVLAFKHAFPQKELICETKISDHEKEIIDTVFKAGGQAVSILCNTHRNIIRSAVLHAHNRNMRCFLDLIGSQTLTQNALDAAELGVDTLQVHYQLSFSQQESIQEQWELLKNNTKLPIFISTGINRNTIDTAIKLSPAGLIIGGSITDQAAPKDEAEFFYRKIRAV